MNLDNPSQKFILATKIHKEMLSIFQYFRFIKKGPFK